MTNPTIPPANDPAQATPTPAQIDAMTTLELTSFLASHSVLLADLAAARLEVEARALEIYYLRLYGIKDRMAMAEDAMARDLRLKVVCSALTGGKGAGI